MSDNLTARNIRPNSVHNLSDADLTTIITQSLRDAFADKKSAVKGIMRVANCNERTAKNWYSGKNSPDALNLLRLMAEIPELQAEVRRLTSMQSDLDPHFEKAMNETVQLFMKMREGKL